jgi:putative nucleotidyltransferase with HDIG domain
VRIFLNVLLILLGFLACYIEDLYLCLVPIQKGTVVPFAIRTRDPFNFDQEKAFGTQRMAALSKYVPLYTYVPGRATEAAAEFQTLLDKITHLSLQKSNGTQQFMEYVKAGYGLDVPEDVVKKLFRFSDLRNFVNGIVTLEESILKGKIIEDAQRLAEKDIYEVLYPKPSGIVAFPAADVITLDAARATLQEKVQQVFWQVDKGIRDAIISIALTTLGPNLIYDLQENNQRVEEIINRYPSSVIPFETGHVLVPFRHELSENDLPLLLAYREDAGKDLFAKAPWIFITVLLTTLFYNLILEKIIKDEWRKDPPYRLFMSLLAITVFLLKACLLLTPIPLIALPFGALPLMLVLLQRDKVSSTWTTLTAGLLVSLLSGSALNVLLFFSFAGIGAVIISLRIRRRMHILFASLAIGGVNAFLFLSFWLDWSVLLSPSSGPWILRLRQVFDFQFLGSLGWAFLGGVAAGPLALVLLPLLEMGWHTASTFKLDRFADLQHPLLKELLTKSPATYQHTMTVAYLAQSVGEAIGANTVLLRIGAYYHDIGKVANPRFFRENQSGESPHDDLDPHESARIIIDHVINGEEMGRGMKLPQAILDFVTQHHGTQTVEFFHTQAVKNNRGGRVQKKDFQYPGPKPQSVEVAIVMICDAVEAASRSLETPTRQAIENMVRFLLVKRINDGQFDECHLSTGCLAQILQTLVNSIEASFHSRAVYPWQQKQKEKIKVIAKAASA